MSHQVVHYVEDIMHDINREKNRNRQQKDGVREIDVVSINQRLRWWITNLDVLILFKTRNYGSASFENLLGMFCRNFKIEKCSADLIEQTLTEHLNKFVEIDQKYPYPIWADKLKDTNYLYRYDAIVNLKNESIKKLKNILTGKLAQEGLVNNGVVQDVSPDTKLATCVKTSGKELKITQPLSRDFCLTTR